MYEDCIGAQVYLTKIKICCQQSPTLTCIALYFMFSCIQLGGYMPFAMGLADSSPSQKHKPPSAKNWGSPHIARSYLYVYVRVLVGVPSHQPYPQTVKGGSECGAVVLKRICMQVVPCQARRFPCWVDVARFSLAAMVEPVLPTHHYLLRVEFRI